MGKVVNQRIPEWQTASKERSLSMPNNITDLLGFKQRYKSQADHLCDETVLFKQWNKLAGRNDAAFRMDPPYESFRAGDLTRFIVDLRLIPDPELSCHLRV